MGLEPIAEGLVSLLVNLLIRVFSRLTFLCSVVLVESVLLRAAMNSNGREELSP